MDTTVRERDRRIGVAEALRELLAALNSDRSLAEILDFALEQAIGLLDSHAGAVYLFEADAEHLAVSAARGLNPDRLAARLRVGSPITGLAVQLRRPVVFENLPLALGNSRGGTE